MLKQITLVLVVPFLAVAENNFWASEREWKVGASFSSFFRTKAQVRSIESTALSFPPVNASDRFYDDGYVRADSSGNLGDAILPSRTHFFGFNDASQVTLSPGAGTIDFHTMAYSGGGAPSTDREKYSPGFEVFLSRSFRRTEDWDWGLEVGMNYQDFFWRPSSPGANFLLMTDTYQLGGVDPTVHGVPYQGRFLPQVGGSPKIGDSASRVFSNTPAVVTGRTVIEGFSLVGRLGPTLTYRASNRWRLAALTGLALGYSRMAVDYNERISSPTGAAAFSLSRRGRFRESDWWLGYLAAARVTYYLDEKWSVHGETRYLWSNSLGLNDGFRAVEIDMNDGLGLLIGLAYDF